MSVKQIKRIPRGTNLKQVALLGATPEELTRDHGVTFTDDSDDLGPMRWAALAVDGEPFLLMQHQQSLEPRTVAYGQGSAEPLEAALRMPDAWTPDAPEFADSGQGGDPAPQPDAPAGTIAGQ